MGWHEKRITVITCAKNEEKFLSLSLISLLNQTLLPTEIIIVNDRSTDRTGEIAEKFAKMYPSLIRVVHRSGNPKLEDVKEIPKAFNEGLKYAGKFDFLAKIDADMVLMPEYFKTIIVEFQKDEKLGIAGGKTINEEHISVRGGNRVFRHECWREISNNGLMPVVDPEDTYTTLKAWYLGWKVKLVDEARSFHLRPMKSLPLKKIIKQRWRVGLAYYRFGGHPLSFLGKLLLLSTSEKPYLLSILLASSGWIYGFLKRERIDEALRKYNKARTKGLVIKRCLRLLG
ncbi:MAG: glycosyltransferase [Candidatus Bathyarchaeota archaeon]